MNNDQTFAALEAVGFAFAGGAIASVGQALVSGTVDWRVILGAALIAGLAKVFPSQMAQPHVPSSQPAGPVAVAPVPVLVAPEIPAAPEPVAALPMLAAALATEHAPPAPAPPDRPPSVAP